MTAASAATAALALNFVLLHVDSPAASAAFYAGLLGRQPVEESPTFALFKAGDGLMLGLWSRHTVEPAATAPGGSEIAFSVADEAAVRNLHADWSARGLAILQPPTRMDFGHTFVAQDPDGHRLRVFAPSQDEAQPEQVRPEEVRS
ncbi:VOC family protein [Azospirillum picis]|uniref:Catechol 2,3-dioxygenase-like lactoylglutathione lyase family enzyme n=1 Tax=Azospirillum picis TaxID=488438 RepID=A0ABU0ML13_9PROT|nr:VOC family protein [Azospirillum picis]MBP2300352.1 catechol 2,3-dioxygenase-like lactoylglutathione lyase family enzyme [Azospirillum picis]MDQ0534148.1 catechol 2,3-dioxygenase-like lactoylglutathione lyase family enzyme [Azospirillum picis]